MPRFFNKLDQTITEKCNCVCENDGTREQIVGFAIGVLLGVLLASGWLIKLGTRTIVNLREVRRRIAERVVSSSHSALKPLQHRDPPTTISNHQVPQNQNHHNKSIVDTPSEESEASTMVASSYVQCNNPACDLKQSEVLKEDHTKHKGSPCEMSEKCANACAAYGRVCPCAARMAGKAARRAVEKLREDSKVFVSKPNITMLNCDDLLIKDKLGEGGFSVAHECVVQAGEEKGKTFAVKYLKRKAMVNRTTFELGAADLAVEAHFLATLDHPHIVKLHGVTAGSVETNVASGKECGYFIVVDRLHDTLEQRIEKLSHEQTELFHAAGLMGRRSHEYKAKRRAALNDRLKYALQVAEAMKYLHEKNIIFRDLKPDNIGFDDDGNIKIFDFGLAKEVKESLKCNDGKYKMTGNTGSRRYMAPEVAKEKHYGLSVDVYSFGILLWELCALQKPFFGYSAGKHMTQVVLGGERPRLDTLNTSWFPVNLQWLLKKCWSSFNVNRPDFDQIIFCLKDIISGHDEIPSVPDHHRNATSKTAEDKIAPPTGGFGSIKKMNRHRRHRSGGDGLLSAAPAPSPSEDPLATPSTAILAPPKHGFKSIPKASASGKRAQTWGFGTRNKN